MARAGGVAVWPSIPAPDRARFERRVAEWIGFGEWCDTLAINADADDPARALAVFGAVYGSKGQRRRAARVPVQDPGRLRL